MPENNNLKPTSFPMAIRFGEAPTTEFKNNLENIKVTLKSAPAMEQLRDYMVGFATATWDDSPAVSALTTKEADRMAYMVFKGKLLPSAMETVKLTFLLEGISYQDVSHILRYRTATFSAECSADKWWTHKDVTVPTSIENSPEFYARYKKLHEDMKQLYVDMIDSKEVSLIDARYVLTRGMETYYWMSMDLKTALNFIRDRVDKQIQPQSDNVIAYMMAIELVERFPLLAEVINIHEPAWFYINTARTGRCTNLFVPDADSADHYEWNRDDYLYKRERSEVNGTDPELSKERKVFDEIFARVGNYLAVVRKQNRERYGEAFFEV